MNTAQELHLAGQSIWYDNIQRSLLRNGELAGMIARGEIRGVTSNPTIFMHAITRSHDYDSSLAPLLDAGLTAEQIFFHLAIEDIQAAADLFRPLYDESRGGDGYVSLEGQPSPGAGYRRYAGAGKRAVAACGPAEPDDQNPSHPGGAAGDRRCDCRGDQHQRDADLLAAALRKSHGCVPVGPGAPCSVRPAVRIDRLRGVVLRLAGRYQRGRTPGEDPRLRIPRWRQKRSICSAKQPSPTPAWRMPTSRKCSLRTGSKSLQRRERAFNARCGRQPAPKTPPIAMWSTWRS